MFLRFLVLTFFCSSFGSACFKSLKLTRTRFFARLISLENGLEPPSVRVGRISTFKLNRGTGKEGKDKWR